MLPPEILELVRETYPDGFEDNLISFSSPSGELQLALPLETEDASYLIKMPKNVDVDSGGNEEENAGGEEVAANNDSPKFENIENVDVADESTSDD